MMRLNQSQVFFEKGDVLLFLKYDLLLQPNAAVMLRLRLFTLALET